MRLPGKLLVLMVAGLMGGLSACRQEKVDLAAVLALARGQLVNADRTEADVDELLSVASGRPVSVSLAYLGCTGGAPRMAQLQAAADSVVGGNVLHIVLDAIDEPSRYADIVRDVTGADARQLDLNRLRIVFVKNSESWPKQVNQATKGIADAMGMRYARDSFVETVRAIGLFDETGTFIGIRY